MVVRNHLMIIYLHPQNHFYKILIVLRNTQRPFKKCCQEFSIKNSLGYATFPEGDIAEKIVMEDVA